ncbi:exodeoxyribonuclease VII large subunit [Candidatus Uhrbacteria bacterium]|nr:exodeoxyribonuclease VII large subunit [Candidatus Uhrbacteria bacterium]
MDQKILTVSEFTHAVSDYLEQGLGVVAIQGEVVDFRVAKEKLVYFTLKDATAQVLCFMMVWDLHQPLEDGMEVKVTGTPKLFTSRGQFHVRVMEVELVGAGALQRAFQILKTKLEKEGLFAPERKRALPRFPRVIGLVTSEDAAAYTDVLRILNNRWQGLEIILAHVPVQGVGAISEIVAAIKWFSQLPTYGDPFSVIRRTGLVYRPDVVIVTRGGGSLEDLQAFNAEEVARAIFASTVPVVVGVGHERDVTLADLVADVRAATPSNAAELVVPDRRDILYQIDTMVDTIEDAITGSIRERSNTLVTALTRGAHQWIERFRSRLEHATQLLNVLSPKAVLARGYSITMFQGKTLRAVKNIHAGDHVKTTLADGEFKAVVDTI